MGRLYLILCLFLGMLGCAAGGLSGLGGKKEEARAPMLASASTIPVSGTGEARFQAAIPGDALVLERQSDGHFYADVEVNGAPIRMLVDTGASGVALSEEDARRAGIATTIGMNDHIGEGAGGAVYGNSVAIERVSLGGVEARGVSGVVLSGGQMSLLGQDFLRRFDRVEIAGDRMILHQSV